MAIKRVNHGRYHSYIDTDTGEKIRSVTTILGDGLPKPALLNWSAEATAAYAVDNWDALGEKSVSVRLKELNGARYAERDKAANRGTQVHAVAQRLVAGEAVPVPDGLEGHVQSYVRFLDDFDVQPIHVEAVIVSHAHRYCGTFDLLANLFNHETNEYETWLLDIKTNKSGIFGETALQLAAYRYADAIAEQPEGNEVDMPEVLRTGAVHVRADGYSLVPVEAGELQHRQFLYVAQVAEFVNNSRGLVGEEIVSQYASDFRLVRDLVREQ